MFNSPIDEIKNRLDIVEVIGSYIKLQKAGANYRANCPFHSEKKPSFFVSPNRQIWHCFGCNLGGDVFKFVMKIEGIEFGDALKILAQKAGIELKKENPQIKTQRQRLYEISELACRFFEKQLEKSNTGQQAKKYLLSRGLKEETIKKWRLGYAPDVWESLSNFLIGKGFERKEIVQAGLALKSEKTNNFYDRFRKRIIFPIFDLSSQVIGFGARILETSYNNEDSKDLAKYINTPATLLYDKGRILYGLNFAGQEIRKKDSCILMEGYMDVIIAHQAGFKNTVAVSGTALTSWQLNILKRYSDNLFTAFDMDVAGNNATKRSIDLAQERDFNVKIITMPEDKDPADVISQNPSQWQTIFKNAKTIHDFYFENTLNQFNKNTIEGKKKILKVLLPIIKKIPNKIEQDFWIQDLANVLETKEEFILEELSKIRVFQTGIENFNQTQKEDKEVVPVNKKTRKELLEEYFIALLLKSPKNIGLIKKEYLPFLSPQTLTLINYFEGKEYQNKQLKEFEEKINHLSFRAEFLEIENEKVEIELQNCLQEIKTLNLQTKLDEISKEIKKAEREKNFEMVQKLTKEFYQLCLQKKS